MVFKNREQAGKKLSSALKDLNLDHPLVIAFSNGGIPVAVQVAHALSAELDYLAVKKIRVPENPEYVIGALTEGGVSFIHESALKRVGLSGSELQELLKQKQASLQRQIDFFRSEIPMISPFNRNIILVDDGLASGSSARVSLRYLKSHHPKSLTLAIPVCPRKITESLKAECDEFICLYSQEDLAPFSQFYQDYFKVSDSHALRILHGSQKKHESHSKNSSIYASSPTSKSHQMKLDLPHPVLPLTSALWSPSISQSSQPSIQEIEIYDSSCSKTPIQLKGILQIPSHCKGIVIFAHGSGSSHLSPRSQIVAQIFHQTGLGTLLFDLLTPDESNSKKNIFNIPQLGARLLLALREIKKRSEIRNLPIGLFGASTGAAAALWSAAHSPHLISSIVSRGGRPDLVLSILPQVSAPVLLIVGSNDTPVIEMNSKASAQLKNGKLILIPGATHLFEEPGALELVAESASQWFHQSFTSDQSEKKWKQLAP